MPVDLIFRPPERPQSINNVINKIINIKSVFCCRWARLLSPLPADRIPLYTRFLMIRCNIIVYPSKLDCGCYVICQGLQELFRLQQNKKKKKKGISLPFDIRSIPISRLLVHVFRWIELGGEELNLSFLFFSYIHLPVIRWYSTGRIRLHPSHWTPVKPCLSRISKRIHRPDSDGMIATCMSFDMYACMFACVKVYIYMIIIDSSWHGFQNPQIGAVGKRNRITFPLTQHKILVAASTASICGIQNG